MKRNFGRRRSIRLKDYDYSQSGIYFITICTASKRCLFCTNSENSANLSHIGKIARECWFEIPNHFKNAKLDEFVVMPNHIHGIIGLTDKEQKRAENFQPLQPHEQNVGVQYIEPTSPQNRFQHITPKSLGSIIRSYKSAVTRQSRKDEICEIFWQRNFYERVIRSEKELGSLREYIANNHLKWNLDRENPASENYDSGLIEYLGLK